MSKFIPRCFLPDFTWPDRRRPLAVKQIPSPPQPTPPYLRRFWGFVHLKLRAFSMHYCKWVGIQFDNQIIQLPFGLVLKWSDGTRVEEVLAMQVARRAGFPVPRVLCYGEHRSTPHAPVSILMTRVPGSELGRVYESLSAEERQSILLEMKSYLGVMRHWANPHGKDEICSITGAAIRSVRVPGHLIGPFDSEADFNKYLIQPAWRGGFASDKAYEQALDTAKGMNKLSHRVLFTHGDFKHHNIMVKDGRVTGFLDWESAGWYPEYWEFTTALRFTRKEFWWYDFVIKLGAGSYLMELECEHALTSLTSESFSW